MKFETIEAYNLPERIEAISKYLVSILSVNGTRGKLPLQMPFISSSNQHLILKNTQGVSGSKLWNKIV